MFHLIYEYIQFWSIILLLYPCVKQKQRLSICNVNSELCSRLAMCFHSMGSKVLFRESILSEISSTHLPYYPNIILTSSKHNPTITTSSQAYHHNIASSVYIFERFYFNMHNNNILPVLPVVSVSLPLSSYVRPSVGPVGHPVVVVRPLSSVPSFPFVNYILHNDA